MWIDLVPEGFQFSFGAGPLKLGVKKHFRFGFFHQENCFINMHYEDDGEQNDEGCFHHGAPVYIAIEEDMVPACEEQYTDRHGIKRDDEQQCADLSHGVIEPVKITPQGEEQVTVSLPYDEGDADGIEITHLDLQQA